ncbi:MAG: hypothetical protein KDA25_02345, partial [Phycisphaerales bacterium]|nr:hypothetical protein [Phycisphaerales bacterium]
RNEDGVVDAVDTTLGYRNGIIESLDRYAKVHGRLVFAVSRETWETANGGSYQQVVTGAIRPSRDDAAVRFEATEEELREITTDMFGDSQTWFETESLTGDAFMDQVNASLAEGGDASFTAPASYEAVPFGAPGAYDYYQRPVFANMTFTNVRVPKGMNPLFESCTFVGVTYVETNTDCDHENWNYAGALELVDGDYVLKFPYIYAEDAGGTIPDTKVESNSVRFQDCTFLGSVAGDKPEEYAHWRNKIQFTGNTRFYLDPDDDEVAEQDDGATLVALLNGLSAADRQELAKSSILMPGWSVDVGNFANEQAADPEDTPTVRLRGTIVAGILDVRGTADVFGTLLMTFRPVANAGPLFYGGLPDAFNTTIGYFGPADGDGEGSDPDDAGFEGFGEITLRYDPDARLPDGIPWPISCAPDVSTYAEGGG